jgi:hypothetical protein
MTPRGALWSATAASCPYWPTSLAGGAYDPAFELLDRRRVMTYWVRVIPTPRQAAVLLEEYGGPPEEERGNPYK